MEEKVSLNKNISEGPAYRIKTDPYSSHGLICKYLKNRIQERMRILDLGSDVGFLGRLLDSFPKKAVLHAVDINAANLKKAQPYYAKTFCFDLNSKVWPLTQKYNIVVLADTLEHLLCPYEVLETAFNLVRSKGTLIVSIPNSVYWWARLVVLSGNFPQQQRGIFDRTHLHFYTYHSFRRMIKSLTRVKKIEYKPTTLPLQFLFRQPLLRFPLQLMYDCSYVMAQLIPSLFAYQHIFIISKK